MGIGFFPGRTIVDAEVEDASPLVTKGWERKPRPAPTSDRIPASAPLKVLMHAHKWKGGAEEMTFTVKEILRMINNDAPQNPAAVIGGLVALGDPRVCDLIVPIRATLDADQVAVVTKCYSGITAKCVVHFYLDWLDELVDRRDSEGEGIFGNVVAGLYRLANDRKAPFVVDGLRPLPVPPAPGLVDTRLS